MNRLLTLILFVSGISYAQMNTAEWTFDPSMQLGFTENNNRFEAVMDEEPLYFITTETYLIYLSNDAIVYSKPIHLDERKDINTPREWDSFKIEFLKTNSSTQIQPLGKKNYTRNYSNANTAYKTIKANAYDSLVYKNIYPNIDLLLELPAEGGLKYSFIIHPKGNSKDILMEYTNIKVNTAADGGLQLTEEHHALTDMAPKSTVNGQEIESSFQLADNRVRFDVGKYNKKETLIIDPWLVDDFPTTVFTRGVLELAADTYGNCTVLYFYDISDEIYTFDDSGTLLWTFGSFNSADIAMSLFTSDIYVSAANGFTRLIDITGETVASVSFAGFTETWRVRYNTFLANIVFGDGGEEGDDSHITTLAFDYTGEETYEVLTDPGSLPEDCVLLEVDPTDGAIYFLATGVTGSPAEIYSNKLYKVDGESPTSILWETPTGYNFSEESNALYALNRNGVNGIACGETYVYTYDGEKAIQYDKMTGEKTDSIDFETPRFWQYGVDTDGCGDVYFGSEDSVFRYDSDLNYLTGYPLPGHCYDLQIMNDKLYACGDNYVTQIDIDLFMEEISLIASPAYCGSCSGSVELDTVICANWELESITWMPGGFTEISVGDLCEGWYTAETTWTNELGETFIITDSVEVLPVDLELEVADTITPPFCSGVCDGTVLFTPENGLPPYTFNLDGEISSDGFFTDLCEGTYPITIIDANGCVYNDVISIVPGGGLGLAIQMYNDPTCYGFADGSITVETAGGSEDVTYTWFPENPVEGSTFNNLSEGTYTVVATFGDCIDTLEITLIQPDSLWAEFTVVQTPCFEDSNGVVVIDTVHNAQGDIGNISYFWAPNYFGSGGVGVDSAYGMPTGSYTVTINDDNGCSIVYPFTLGEYDSLYFTELGYDPAFCRLYDYQSGNGVVYAGAAGGTPGYTYEWVNTETMESTENTTWGGLNPGTYCITVTDAVNCTLVECIELDSVNPIAAFTVNSDQLDQNCEGTETVFANFVNQSLYFANPNDPGADTTFFWSLNYPTEDWTISHDYFEQFDTSYVGEAIYPVCLIAFNKNGCADTTCKDLIVHVVPEFTAPNIFTPAVNGKNDDFRFDLKSLGIKTFSCIIVNRWGVKVAELNGIEDSWDGSDFNGDDCPDGVYFYNYVAVATNHTEFNGQGTVQLVRR